MTGPETIDVGISDELLLGGLFGDAPQSGTGELWQTAWRSGHLLALARREPTNMAEILRFYRALRLAGRAYQGWMSLASRSPFWGLLPARSYPARGFIQKFESTTGRRVTAVLFGNPIQSHRRVILRAERHGEQVWFVKVGFSPDAVAAIRRELSILTEANGSIPDVPNIAFQLDEAGTAALGTVELPGIPLRGPENHLTAAVNLLQTWTRFDEARPLASFSVWPKIAAAFSAADPALIQRLGELVLPPAFSHGDFAAWNLIVDPVTGSLAAVDWEWADRDGVPGWDLIHLYCQQAAMVMRANDAGIASYTLRLMNQPAAAAYLKACGWPSPETAFATYASCLNPIFRGPSPAVLPHLVSTSAFPPPSLSASTP